MKVSSFKSGKTVKLRIQKQKGSLPKRAQNFSHIASCCEAKSGYIGIHH
jgi:hypothetical protein